MQHSTQLYTTFTKQLYKTLRICYTIVQQLYTTLQHLPTLYTIVFKLLHKSYNNSFFYKLSKTLQHFTQVLQNCTIFYKTVHNFTKLYTILEKTLQNLNITKLYKTLHNFTQLYNMFQNSTRLLQNMFRTIQTTLNTLHNFTSFTQFYTTFNNQNTSQTVSELYKQIQHLHN